MWNQWQELPEGDWFCCNDCTRIHSTLENLLIRVAERLPESLLDVIKKKQVGRCLEPLNEIDVRWKLLNGKIASPETRPLLLEAVSMFHVSSVCPYELLHHHHYYHSSSSYRFIVYHYYHHPCLFPMNGRAALHFY